MIEERIQVAKQYVKTLFADRADGHDVEHTLRVYTNAMRIAQAEGPCDLEIVGLSALLHDADDDKLFQTENHANARKFLEEIGTPKNQIEQICRVINAVSFSKNRGKHPETLEGKIVQDADRLDAIGAVGIDVQRQKTLRGNGISQRFFSCEEQKFAEFHGLNGFFQIWAAKEAYTKYLGLGLSYPFSSFSTR